MHILNKEIKALSNHEVLGSIHFEESTMNRDQIKGQMNSILGTGKEAVGKIFENKEIENKGKIQKSIGKSQVEFGNLNNNLKKWRMKRI